MATLMNYLVRRYLNKWDHELEQISNNCRHVQKLELEKILKAPLFRFFHGLLSVNSFYSTRITEYEDYNSRIQDLILKEELDYQYFAQSSGTTSGQKKLIPTPNQFVKKNHLRGSWYLLHTLYKHNPSMSVFRSKNLLIGGSIYDRNSKYTVGDISGIMLDRIPIYMRPWYVPKISQAVMPDWEEKLEITAKAAAKTRDISLLGGAPTWVLAVLKKCLHLTGARRINELWPNLQAYIHGGVNFEPYREQFSSLFTNINCRLIEVYNATEGFFAFQDRPDEEGMLLMCSSGIYFEFIKLEDYEQCPTRIIGIDQVELGQAYVMLITSLSGLSRYVQGDIIRFVEIAPYRIKVIGRIQEYINAFGEDLYKQDAENALSKVLELYGSSVVDYTVAPKYLTIADAGYHEWFVEFDHAPKNVKQFALELDRELQNLNSNYQQKRIGDISMKNLVIIELPKGSINQYLRSQGSITGQSKMPRLRNDRKIAEALHRILHPKISTLEER